MVPVMKALILPFALLAAPLAPQVSAQAPAPAARLDPELQTAVRCAALFSIVAGEQARQAPAAAGWPPLAERGREFFVRVGARVMDAAGLDRAGLGALMRAEAAALQPANGAGAAPGTAARSLREPCLAMLDATVPPVIGR